MGKRFFFSVPSLRGAGIGGTRGPSSSSASGDAARSESGPRSGRRRVPPSSASAPVADPARLDRCGQLLEGRVGGYVREVVFALARAALLAHQPDLVSRQVLVALCADPLGRTIGHPDAQRAEAAPQPTLGAVPPGRRPAGHVCQDRLGRNRDLI